MRLPPMKLSLTSQATAIPTPNKDRAQTEQRILQALSEIISTQGFEKVGVNAVAKQAGVSKMLLYRYFGGMDELIAAYILKGDYWINVSSVDCEKEAHCAGSMTEAGAYIKNVFRTQIAQLRGDITLRKMYRWELTSQHPVTRQLREKREESGYRLVEFVAHLTRTEVQEVAALATLLSASISYLTLLEEVAPVYNGIPIQSNQGWEQIAQGIDLVIDLWLNQRT